MSYSQLKLSFENVTKNVWEGLENAYNYDISFGETTISDMILLYLKKLNNPKITIRQTKQNEEPEFGTDWLWCVGSEDKGWIAFAVQAKKYHTKNDRYNSLYHKIGGSRVEQSKVLRDYAQEIDAVPIYALYNYVLDDNFCTGINGLISSYSKEMYGVTVTPLANVKNALKIKGGRSFKSLHHSIDTVPLPELIELTKNFLNKYTNRQFSNILGFHPVVHKELPIDFAIKRKTHKESKFKYIFDNDSFIHDIHFHPKRILVINIEDYD